VFLIDQWAGLLRQQRFGEANTELHKRYAYIYFNIHTSLMKHFAVINAIRQTDIPALLDSSFINTPSVKMLGPQTICLPYNFVNNEELSDLYSLPNIVRVVKSRRMRWAGHVARIGQGRGVYRVLVGKPEEKRPLGRPRRRWEDNIKMELQEVGGGCGD